MVTKYVHLYDEHENEAIYKDGKRVYVDNNVISSEAWHNALIAAEESHMFYVIGYELDWSKFEYGYPENLSDLGDLEQFYGGEPDMVWL